MKIKLLLISILILELCNNAQAQKTWGGNMLKVTAVPDMLADAVCNDSSLFWLRPDGNVKKACAGHQGVKAWTKGQYLDLQNGKYFAPETWTHPVTAGLEITSNQRHFSTPLTPLAAKTKLRKNWEAPHMRPYRNTITLRSLLP